MFAHADASGNDDDNKALTDRRARAAQALLVGNVDALVATWHHEAWDDTTFQVMLRALECDPGRIDGDLGHMTTSAVEAFQRRYNERVYNQASSLDAQPRFASIKVDADLGPETKEALVESYVLSFSPAVPADSFASNQAANGCAAFNQAVDDPTSALNRRVSLLVTSTAPAYPDATPCTSGDPQRCPVVDKSRSGCLWYREHVREPVPAQAQHEHFSPSWLQLPNGRFMLSVLTTVPEDETVTFEVWSASDPVDDTSRSPGAGSFTPRKFRSESSASTRMDSIRSPRASGTPKSRLRRSMRS